MNITKSEIENYTEKCNEMIKKQNKIIGVIAGHGEKAAGIMDNVFNPSEKVDKVDSF